MLDESFDSTDRDWSGWMKPAVQVTCLCGVTYKITGERFCDRCGQRLAYQAALNSRTNQQRHKE